LHCALQQEACMEARAPWEPSTEGCAQNMAPRKLTLVSHF